MKFSAKKKNENRGSILVESIVAINIIVVGLLGVLNVLSNSLALNRDVGQKFVATYLAVEGVEVVKNLIDTNYAKSQPWNAGLNEGFYALSYDSDHLIPDSENYLRLNNGIYDYNEEGEATFFKRIINIENVSADEIKVISIVEWRTKKGLVRVDLEDHFFNWR